METKECIDCKVIKPLSDFYLRNKKSGKPQGHCKKCAHERTRKWKKRNPKNVKRYNAKVTPERHKGYHLKKKYGLTLDEYLNMLDNQNKRCLICSDPLGDAHEVNVDHCHKGGHVRGILCNHCNRGLGAFRDSTTNLKMAIAYLEHDNAKQFDKEQEESVTNPGL